ncbi:hypothetical protein ASPZODRAFT_588822 [Penicilliopsis zonata CBS 506.65]|uniref:Uncharacterized protein n=1 Tax=Penicilliopsis zonata CBS 506.65 TaxID=1073090 RepID=A0A1L9SE03_9EURO|nr:hypothetical protein ASPZODRAFT_588822 [Penicilliopsis zonata CBS 506.65]OJJ45409.1 hypothetical protein ASPZODRAFT_588822 [Penicilliopsis zonata CBS 506.65]
MCCPSGRRRRDDRTKYMDEPTGYHQPPPAAAAAAASSMPTRDAYQSPAAPPVYRGPSTATFDASRRVSAKTNDDVLPSMPTWENSASRRVEDIGPHPDEMEMKPLNSPTQQYGVTSAFPPSAGAIAAAAPAARQAVGGRRGAPPPQRMQSPAQHYDYRGAHGSSQYNVASPGPETPVGRGAFNASPYEQQPYNDYSYGNDQHSYGYQPQLQPQPQAYPQTQTRPQAPGLYIPQQQQHQQYNPVSTMSPSHEMPEHTAFQRQPSFASTQPPPTYVSDYQEPQYSQAHPLYHDYSPSHVSSPPPPFSPTAPEPANAVRPPSLLQSGRRPVANSWRNI